MPFIYRKKDLEEAKPYITNKTIPVRLTTKRDIQNFKKKWDNITLDNDRLLKGDKEIILKENIGIFLAKLYNDTQYSYVGRDKLFSKIKEKFINVSIRDVNAFLKNHETNQVHLPRKKVIVSRPVRTKKTNSVWYVDLIIINKKKTKKREYGKLDKVILTVVNAFSKFAWVKVIEGTKDSKTVAKKMKEIFQEESPNIPNVIHSDNGGEFKKHFKDLLKEIQLIQVI